MKISFSCIKRLNEAALKPVDAYMLNYNITDKKQSVFNNNFSRAPVLG